MLFSFEDCLAFFLAALPEFEDGCSLELASRWDAVGEAAEELEPSVSGEPVWRCRLLDFDMVTGY